ncbi:MAG: diacylglycerol/lipid kinase family protein [Chloroflexia bacterium]
MGPFSHYRVIVNPWAGRGAGARLLPSLPALLQGLPCSIVTTEGPRHATTLAAAAAREGADVIVACGGDGTILEVLNGLVGTSATLAVLPIGSGNDFIKPLGIPRELHAAIRLLRNGVIRPIDLGRTGDTYFGNGLGIGFDARVALETRHFPRLSGFPLYLAALWRAVWRYRPCPMRVQIDGQTLEGRFLMLAVANGRCLAANFWLTPQAEMDDGLFDLCLVRQMPLPIFFYHLPKVTQGRHTRLREVHMARARHVTVESAAPLPVHADGEILSEGTIRLEVEIVPRAVRVLCPPGEGPLTPYGSQRTDQTR